MARWCRKNDLNEEARFHWSSVLAVDPNNEEAHQAMDLRWSNGRLLSREEIAAEKALLYQAKRSVKQWAPSIAKWRRAISGSDSATREEALAEVSALGDADVRGAVNDEIVLRAHFVGKSFDMPTICQVTDGVAKRRDVPIERCVTEQVGSEEAVGAG